MKIISKYSWIIAVVLITIAGYLSFLTPYTRTETYKATYLGYTHQLTYRSSYLVGAFRLDNGLVLDNRISTGFALTMKTGDMYNLELKRVNYAETLLENLLFVFLPVLLFAIGCILLLHKSLKIFAKTP